MSKLRGIFHQRISETPVAILDFETTGLTPGFDRVVEVSVVRLDPGCKPRLVFDTLVNPRRPMAATEIHGITNKDVQDAPFFHDIAGDLVAALRNSVVAAYNVYFDMKFLQYELEHAGVRHVPPHICLMYMRPLLGLGCRCSLGEVCHDFRITLEHAHMASRDALASASLYQKYRNIMKKMSIQTFNDLAQLKDYKFVSSFSNIPFPGPEKFKLRRCRKLRSRSPKHHS